MARFLFFRDKRDVQLVIAKRAVYMCMYSAVTDVKMIAKLASRMFACVARNVMIEKEHPFLFYARASRARPP